MQQAELWTMQNAFGMELHGILIKTVDAKWSATPHLMILTSLTTGGDLNTHYRIQQMATQKGIRTLSIWLAPDGNDCDEYQYQMQQATTIKQHLSKAPLGCKHTQIDFQSIWHTMIQYPLGATCFTSKQCQKIQAKYMPTFLSRMGINQATAMALQHGPLHLGGFDVFNLETEQGVMKTKMVLSHLRWNDEVGQMINISCNHLQLQAGVSWLIMSRPGTQQQKYVDPCYLTHLWDFLTVLKLIYGSILISGSDCNGLVIHSLWMTCPIFLA